jgi:hypothetical protein
MLGRKGHDCIAVAMKHQSIRGLKAEGDWVEVPARTNPGNPKPLTLNSNGKPESTELQAFESVDLGRRPVPAVVL